MSNDLVAGRLIANGDAPLALNGKFAIFCVRETGRCPVATIERTPQRLVLKSGSTTLTLDKNVGKATMERKFLFWTRKPMERPLSDLGQVNVDANIDRASGVELCSTMLVMRDGSAWALPPTDRKDATEAATAIRDFLGIAGT